MKFSTALRFILFDERRFKVLTIVDTYCKLSLAMRAGARYRGSDVVQILKLVTQTCGVPKCIRVVNDQEFVSRDLDLLAYGHGVALDFSQPSKSTDNTFIEAFNSRFRQECLNQHWFLDMEEARAKIEAWRREYNMCRSHGALGDRTPQEFLQKAYEPGS